SRRGTEFSGRVCAMKIVLQNAVFDIWRQSSGNTFIVKRRRTQTSRHQCVVDDGHIFGGNCLTDLTDQERAPPINCTSRYSFEEMPQQGTRSQRIKNDGYFCRWNLSSSKSSKSALGGLSADDFRQLHLVLMSGHRNPVISLHSIFRLGNR